VDKLQDVEAQEDPDMDPETKRWRDMERTLITRVAQGTAMASIVLNLVAMIFEAGSTIAMGLIGIFIGSVVIYFQFALQDEDSLRQVQNDLRHKVNDFAELNFKLTKNNDRLKGQLEPLKECEQELKVIAEKSGQDVDTLKNLVKENQAIVDAFDVTSRQLMFRELIEKVLDSDRDKDGHYSDKNIKALTLKMTGIEFDKQKFVERIKASDRTLSNVMSVIRTINDQSLSEEERIFKMPDQQGVIDVLGM